MNDHNLARFDWYQATVDQADDGRIPAMLAMATGSKLVAGRGRNGYAQNTQLVRDDELVAEVLGHSARLGEAHVVVTSESCDEVVPLIREHYPNHRVSRADSAIDFLGLDFEQLDRELVEFSTGTDENGRLRNLSSMLISDSEGGSTRYLGSPRSEVRVRVYKKTEQLRSQNRHLAHTIPDGVVRFELVMRPGKRDIKEKVAQMGAGDLWGCAQWSQDLASEVMNLDAERTSTHFRRPSQWSRMLHYLGVQYGPAIAKRVAETSLAETQKEVLKALGLEDFPDDETPF